MTQDEILDFNKRCAEFRNIPNRKDYKGDLWDVQKMGMDIYCLRTTDLKYHSDWNLIMDVIESIEQIDRGDEHGKFRLIRYGSSCNWNNLPPSINEGSPLECTIKALYNFLIWYYDTNR